MQLIITDAWLAKTKTVHLSGFKLSLIGFVLVASLVTLGGYLHVWAYSSGLVDKMVSWGMLSSSPISTAVAGSVNERYVKENLAALAQKLGDLQAKVDQVESLAQRVSGLAGVPLKETTNSLGKGGLFLPPSELGIEHLDALINQMDEKSSHYLDHLTVVESTLFDQKIKKMMLPTQRPVANALIGSKFGWRADPFNGRTSLHTGLDFAAPTGTPIMAAAVGSVVTSEHHYAYGNMVEIDHGNDLVTRYAHASKILVKKGDLVKRGQVIALVGSTGRSTGPHLHFEVMMQGQFQDPSRFLASSEKLMPNTTSQK